MAKKARRFGAIRKLPSGLWQARYRDANGVMRAAPHTFSRQKDADAWLARIQTEMARGEWVNPDGGKVTLGEYADAWLREHPKLSPKTRVLYGSLLKLHIRPQLGVVRLVDLTTPRIRTWRHQRLTDGIGAVTVAKAYRLLRGMLNTP
jgi:Phage integrase, N-terminal SAM-like domain